MSTDSSHAQARASDGTTSKHAPDRDHLKLASEFGITLSPEAYEYAQDGDKLSKAYGGSGKCRVGRLTKLT